MPSWVVDIDWINFYDDIMYWVQRITTIAVLGLVLIALLGIFINRRITIGCGLIIILLFIVAGVLEGYGIEIFLPELWDFFEGLFN